MPQQNKSNSDDKSKPPISTNIDSIDINANDIILEEYKYRVARKLQVMQERTNTINIYIVLLGIAVSGFALFYPLSLNLKVYSALFLSLILLALGVAHVFFFVRFVIWAIYKYEDAVIMSKIRDFYSRGLQQKNPEMSKILLTSNNIGSNQFSLSTDIIVLLAFALNGSICLGAFTFISCELAFHVSNGLLPLTSDFRPYLFGAVIFLISFFSHCIVFKKMLLDQRRMIMASH